MMKNNAFILLLLLITADAAIALDTAKSKATHVFILAGQSNMVRLDPAVSFTPTLKLAFPNDDIIVIKDAKGGQPIRRWYKKAEAGKTRQSARIGDLYEQVLTRAQAALPSAGADSITLVWMQGESDAKENNGDRYADQLRGVLDQFKQDLGRDDLYFVLGRISDFGLKRQNRRSEWEKIRAAQMRVAEADSRGAWVDTDDLNGDRDHLHYTDEGYRVFGERLAQAAIRQLKK